MSEWTDALAAVADATAARVIAEEAAEQARVRQADAIRAALGARVSVVDLVRATGLTRARIYQIRDDRR